MARESILKMDNISPNRYRELKYFCKQYHEKKVRLQEITEIASPSFEGGRSSGKTSDRTADIAMNRIELEQDVKMIEEAARESFEGMERYILDHVCLGTRYEYLNIPMGIRQFEQRRRKFYKILAEKQKKGCIGGLKK